MKNNTHVINTWLLAHLLHLVVWFIETGGHAGGVGFVFILVIISMVFSFFTIPLYFIANKAIIKSEFSLASKFLLWLLVASSITLICATLLVFLFSGGVFEGEYLTDIFLFSHPSLIATFFAVLIRYDQFRRLNNEYITGLAEKTTEP